MKILITGATGKLGSAIIETLLQKKTSEHIAVLVRKLESQPALQQKGVEVHIGNYDDLISLENAMCKVDTVLLISSTDEGDRMQQHQNVIDIAKKMGVKNIAYTSRSLKDKTTLSNELMLEHFATEDYIIQSGLNYIIFRNALYMDVLPLFLGSQVFEAGIFQPAGNGKIAFALRQEMGEGIANVLLNEAFENKTYRFTGSETYSFYDVANVLSILSGKLIKYTSVEISALEALMKKRGMADLMIKKIIDFNLDIKEGQEETVSIDLENKLGRKPTKLLEGLKTLFTF